MPVIFGSEVSGKTIWIVLGVIGAGVAVVVYARSRGAEEAGAPMAPADFGGGGGGGIPVAAPSDSAAASYNARLEDVQIRAAEFALEQGRTEAGQQARQFDLMLTLNKAYTDFQMALFGQETQVGASRAATQIAGERIVQRSISGRRKVQCPRGEHFVVLADGSTACQPLGGPGFSFKTVTSGIADIVGGVFRGAGEAAPGIGYGAATAYAGRAGIVPRPRPASRPPTFTPGINPYLEPVSFRGIER